MDSGVEEESVRGIRDVATGRGGAYYQTSETHNLFQVQLKFLSGQSYLSFISSLHTLWANAFCRDLSSSEPLGLPVRGLRVSGASRDAQSSAELQMTSY